MASAIPAWAQEVRDAATRNLASLPALTGEEEAWRFTPPADLALTGAEPDAPGSAGAVAVEDGVRAARVRLAAGAPSAPGRPHDAAERRAFGNGKGGCPTQPPIPTSAYGCGRAHQLNFTYS